VCGAEAAIAAQIHPIAAMPPQVRAGGAAEHLNVNVAQFQVGDAADIVLAKDGRVEHHRPRISWRAEACRRAAPGAELSAEADSGTLKRAPQAY